MAAMLSGVYDGRITGRHASFTNENPGILYMDVMKSG